MSNRYTDFLQYVRMSESSKSTRHLQQPTNEKEQRRKNRIEDISENPRKIWGNNAFKNRVRLMQDAMNYRNEVDRIRSDVHERRIPANRRHMYQNRLALLEGKLRYLEPIIAEGGRYHHVG